MAKRPTNRVQRSFAALEVEISPGRFDPALGRYLRRMIDSAVPHLPRGCSALRSVSIALVGDAAMSRLHQHFLRLPGPTDVLTFELEHDGRGRCIGGEIVLCVPHARRLASSHGRSVRNELLLYAIHGMLHLAGFDDRKRADFTTMHRHEDAIFARLGLDPARVGEGVRL